MSENFIKHNQVYIYDVFNESIMKKIIPGLIKHIKSKPKKITFYIDSRGGYVYVLKNLLAQIEIAKKKGIIIETHVMGKAYSCGSILAASGTKGYRFVSPFAEHLPHLGAASSGTVHNDVEAERMNERIKSHFDFVRDCYKKYASIRHLEDVIKNDNYFIRGKKIIKEGLADKMLF